MSEWLPFRTTKWKNGQNIGSVVILRINQEITNLITVLSWWCVYILWKSLLLLQLEIEFKFVLSSLGSLGNWRTRRIRRSRSTKGYKISYRGEFKQTIYFTSSLRLGSGTKVEIWLDSNISCYISFINLNFSLIIKLDVLPCLNILSGPRDMSRYRFVNF